MDFPNYSCIFATICKIIRGNYVNCCNKIRVDMLLIYIDLQQNLLIVGSNTTQVFIFLNLSRIREHYKKLLYLNYNNVSLK